MPRDGAIIFSDLIGKLDVLRVTCEKCGRDGRYRLCRLLDERGREGRLPDWLNEIAGDCPKRSSVNWNDRCRAACPDLPRVL
jgi:hypothetical protein